MNTQSLKFMAAAIIIASSTLANAESNETTEHSTTRVEETFPDQSKHLNFYDRVRMEHSIENERPSLHSERSVRSSRAVSNVSP